MNAPKINRMISGYNFYKGDISRIKYIVIHYVGGLSTAEQNCKYFAGGDRSASAHYFVGHDGEIWQSVEDANSAWHCGASSYKHYECRNTNSIGIELCCRKKNTGTMSATDKDWYFEDATVKAAVELTRYLMEKYGVPAENVIRHYDVTGKICPNPYVYNTTEHTWEEFKALIRQQETQDKETEKTGQDAESVIWAFLSGKGLNDYAVAGIMGNLYAESGLKPGNLQNSYNTKLGITDEEYTAAVDSGSYSREQFTRDSAGYGLAQWTYWSRKQALYDYIKSVGASIGDLQAQLAYLWQELQGYKAVMQQLQAAASVLAASNAMLLGFEKPADQSETVQKRRAGYGQEYYERHARKQVAPQETPQTAQNVPFTVRVDILDLNIRTGAGTEYAKTGQKTGKGIFTIVEVKQGKGSTAGWGRLKSGAGWVSLDYCTKLT